MATVRSEAWLESPRLQDMADLALDQLPFGVGDATAGSEDELQAVVVGSSGDCDLPLSVRESRFFRNIARRSASGEAPRRTLTELEAFLSDTREVWENSWIRFPESRLSKRALQILQSDLQVARNGSSSERSDALRFRFTRNGEPWLRIPISYALKLSLADLVGMQPHMPQAMQAEASRLMRHFLNDNTSPETTSFHIVAGERTRSLGEQTARETARRFLFTSLLMSWANLRFGLLESGQRALVYHAPLPSVHQEELSSCISDSFYRELFMSPCLSGWSDGEEKCQYMHLCHQVLSRSQLNAVAKLREAGIIANELIVLPSLSNVSLSNNGIHISIGSRLLEGKLRAGFDLLPGDEKRLGDLAIKIYEHFLCLFVGTYTAAPYRFGFNQFHPERLLSFLPHELDFTHLRLLWREWKEKAKLSVCGHPVTPYGPGWLDGMMARLFRLQGDCVPDARLLTYPVAWLGSEHSSALDGTAGNIGRLSSELDELGIVDQRMSFYMPLRLRERQRDGYAGFEARYYSLFPSYDGDMAAAANLQQFFLAFAYKLALQGEISHHQIPDDPTSESERRQPFFFSAAGLPAFYVHRDSRNELLRMVLLNCKKTRPSRRHPKYIRIAIADYRRALLAFVQQAGSDLAEAMNLQPVLAELAERCQDEQQHASRRLEKSIAGDSAKNAMKLEAREFNRAAEDFYRDGLRRQHLREAVAHLREDVAYLERFACDETKIRLRHGVRIQDLARFLQDAEKRVLTDDLSLPEITALLNLMLVLTEWNRARAAQAAEGLDATPVH
ncbi:MAG: hypothetical protein ABSD98_00585 [Candidatus Korobacteraceae bacterium]|jgi:hypothetical protein